MIESPEIDFSIDLIKTIIWQYDSAPSFNSLIEKKQEFYDLNIVKFWEDWVRDVFNLVTANDFGLSVWSRILDLPLFSTQEPSPPDYPAFGFDPFGSNFDNGNFATSVDDIVALDTESKRALLRLKYFISVTRPTPPTINKFLSYLFGRGSIYVIDNLDMTMTYAITNENVKVLLPFLITFDLLPRPSAVSLSFVDINRPYFGFEPFASNFENSNFPE